MLKRNDGLRDLPFKYPRKRKFLKNWLEFNIKMLAVHVVSLKTRSFYI